MAGAKQSKTAKASVAAGTQKSTSGVQKSADGPLLIPTGQGSYVYVSSIAGPSVHVRVGSEKYVAEVGALVAAGHVRVLKEVEVLAAQFPTAPWAIPA